MLILIRHALTAPRRDVPPERWELAAEGRPAMERFREAFPWRGVDRWYTSPEDKAKGTCAALTDEPPTAVPGLEEVRRPWSDAYPEAVAAFLADPRHRPTPGWENAEEAFRRFDAALAGVYRPRGVTAVVTHGLVMTVWTARIQAREPTLDSWSSLGFPDLVAVDSSQAIGWLRSRVPVRALRRFQGWSDPEYRLDAWPR